MATIPDCCCPEKNHSKEKDEDYGMWYHWRECSVCEYYWEGYYGYVE